MNPIVLPEDGGDGLLKILSPVVRWYSANATGKWEKLTGATWAWEMAADTIGTVEAGALTIRLRAYASASGGHKRQWKVEITVDIHEPIRLSHCAVGMEITAETVPYVVDGALRWGTCRNGTSVHEFGHSVLRWKLPDGFFAELRPLRGSHPVRYQMRGNRLRMDVLLDAARLHPRWQFTGRGMETRATPVKSPGSSISTTLVLTVTRGMHDAPPPVPSRYPGGAEAAFVLTDHCDFDDTDALRRFLHGESVSRGWLGRGLRLTKGVFMHRSAPADREPIPTLEDQEYRALIQELHDDGSEIAPHAFSEVGTLPPGEFHNSVRDFSHQWAPATWIDHGKSIPYCYTMGGGSDSRFNLLNALRTHGFTALWSYHDVAAPGCAGLNMLQRPPGTVLPLARQSMKHMIHAELLIGLHYVRTILALAFTGAWGAAMMQIISAAREMIINLQGQGTGKWQVMRRAWQRVSGSLVQAVRRHDASPEPVTHRIDRREPEGVVYPERGVPLHAASAGELMLFTTMEAVHTRDMYGPAALDRLVHERGVHIGHTYLLNRLPYIAGIFERKTGRLSHSWNQFVDVLASQVRGGQIWNPTAGEFAAWARDREHVALTPVSTTEIRVENPLPTTVCGLTLLLPREIRHAEVRWGDHRAKGLREWADWLAVWGDIPARSSISVTWGSRQ